MKLAEICHLYGAAGFGATSEDLQRGKAAGYEACVREMLACDQVAETLPPQPPNTLFPPGVTLGLLQVAALIDWWLKVMIETRRPLLEKMVLFWHGHFTTSADPVFSGTLLARQNETLRANALGRFSDLLGVMARDSAMLVYLDGMKNKKAHPNENFARELLELFTLGIGHYTEGDVKEAARAFTGWTLALPDGHVVFKPEEHDDGPKRFLGQIGPWTAEDILGMVAVHPATARHLCGKLYRFLAGVDASEAEVTRLSSIWQRSHGNIKVVLHAILLGEAFRNLAATRPGYRSPVEFLVAGCRALRGHLNHFSLIDKLRDMGQLPFVPPSVKGWDDGAAWINTQTLVDRINMGHLMAEKLTRTSGLERLMANVDTLLWTLGMPDAAPTTQAVLKAHWERTQSIEQTIELALVSPDFQRR